jgi:hypothetical protein
MLVRFQHFITQQLTLYINWVVDSPTVFLNNTLRNTIERLVRKSDLETSKYATKISGTETTMRKDGV